MARTDIDALAVRLAAKQHGVVAERQLGDARAGAAIRRRIASCRWERVDRGVIRIAGSPASWESLLMTAVLAGGEGAVASHRSAAALHGLDGFGRDIVEVTVPRGRRYRPATVTAHRSRDLHLVEPTLRYGIPVTRIERTLLDLGAVVRPGLVHLAVDDARRRRLTDWERLLGCLTLHARRGRDGVGPLGRILDDHLEEIAVTDSGFERLVLIRLAEVGLPTRVLQHTVIVRGQEFRLDLAYPDLLVAIELDGSVHLRREVWERDRARQNALVLAGWTVLRFTWRDYLQHQTRMLREIRAILGSFPVLGR